MLIVTLEISDKAISPALLRQIAKDLILAAETTESDPENSMLIDVDGLTWCYNKDEIKHWGPCIFTRCIPVEKK